RRHRPDGLLDAHELEELRRPGLSLTSERDQLADARSEERRRKAGRDDVQHDRAPQPLVRPEVVAPPAGEDHERARQWKQAERERIDETLLNCFVRFEERQCPWPLNSSLHRPDDAEGEGRPDADDRAQDVDDDQRRAVRVHQKYTRLSVSATQAGLSLPSTSIVTSVFS